MKLLISLVAVAAFPATALAADYLTLVQSEVYQTVGSVEEITRRANSCIAQQLSSGVAGGQVIISSDTQTGIIISNNTLRYSDRLVPWIMRTRLKFEARDNRFRIEHSNIERFNEYASAWQPVGKWRGAGHLKVEEVLAAQTAQISACVQNSNTSNDNW